MSPVERFCQPPQNTLKPTTCDLAKQFKQQHSIILLSRKVEEQSEQLGFCLMLIEAMTINMHGHKN